MALNKSMKRLWVLLGIAVFALAPTIESSAQPLASTLNLYAQVNTFGDAEIKWTPGMPAHQAKPIVTIRFDYDLGDKPGRSQPKKYDFAAGKAVFTDLSLDSRYVFEVTISIGHQPIQDRRFVVITPKPRRQPTGNSAVDRQLAYVDAHWLTRENSKYMYIPSFDCANFASQTLVARGLPQNWSWQQINKVPTHSFISATALRAYLLTRPSVKELAANQVSKVKLGDLALFDWDRSGDTDHVGVVNYIERRPDGTVKVFIAQHTMHRYYRSVDWAVQVNHPGARMTYLSLPLTDSAFNWSSLFDVAH